MVILQKLQKKVTLHKVKDNKVITQGKISYYFFYFQSKKNIDLMKCEMSICI